MVDVVITGVSARARMADALRQFAGLPLERKQGEEGAGHRLAASPHKIAAAAG
jgi:hypothetical protein